MCIRDEFYAAPVREVSDKENAVMTRRAGTQPVGCRKG